MSLDIYLIKDRAENERLRILEAETFDKIALLQEDLQGIRDEIDRQKLFHKNITHNLNDMADKAGIYEALWRPDEAEYDKASDIIPLLEKGLAKLKAKPDYYKKFNPSNGWGRYEGLVGFVTETLQACKANPDAYIKVSR